MVIEQIRPLGRAQVGWPAAIDSGRRQNGQSCSVVVASPPPTASNSSGYAQLDRQSSEMLMMMNNVEGAAQLGLSRPRRRPVRQHAPMSWNYRTKIESPRRRRERSALDHANNQDGQSTRPRPVPLSEVDRRQMDVAVAEATRFCVQPGDKLVASLESCNHYREQAGGQVALEAASCLWRPQAEARQELNNEQLEEASATISAAAAATATGEPRMLVGRRVERFEATTNERIRSSIVVEATSRCSISAASSRSNAESAPEDDCDENVNSQEYNEEINTEKERKCNRRTRKDERREPRAWLNEARLKPINHCQSSIFTAAQALMKVCLLLTSISGPLISAIVAQQIELGEGLSLNDRHNNNNNNNENADWPLAHLERIKSESAVSAVVGQNVVLNCAVQFKDGQEKPFVVQWLKWPNKLPIYIWYAGYPAHVAQGYERRVARIGQASLNLSSVKESDQGFYECKITYLDQSSTKDKANGTWIFLDVQAPPHFTQTPPAVSYVQAGDSLHLTCQAQSTPAPILRWYKNKVPIDSDAGPYRLWSNGAAQHQSSETSSQHNSSSQATKQLAAAASLSGQSLAQLDLFIDNVQAGSTTGDYVCLASNSEGSVEARSQVALAVPAIITTWPRNQTRLEGESAEFLCQARALPANISYKWLFNDKPISQVKRFESRYRQKPDGSLELHSLQREDEGEFKCRATNGLSHRDRLAAAAAAGSRTTKNKPPAPPPIYAEAAAHLSVEFPARVTYSPPVQFLPLNMAGQIRCFVAAVPAVEFFTWTLNNQQFDPNADPNIERLANGSLIIRQVSKHYEGAYRCTPFNKHGSAGSSAAMEVRVEEAPTFTQRPNDFYKANLNGEVRLACDAKGSPQPQVSWRKVVVKTRGGSNSSSSSSSESSSTEQTLDRRRRRSPTGATSTAARTTRKFTNNNQAHLAFDEANDEPDENHHFYATTSPTGTGLEAPLNEQEELATAANGQQQPISISATGSGGTNPADVDTNRGHHHHQQQQQQQQQQQEQQTVISYEKVPQARAEFKNGQLVLRNLRKEDHGRYECVVENEVATLVAPTMLYIEETTPHAPTDVHVETKSWSAQVTWTAGYDGGFEQSFVVWYRQIERPRTLSSESALPSPSELLSASQQQQQQELIDVNWHSINVQSSDSTSLTVHNLSQDTSYEFYVRAKNIIGDGPRSRIVQATTRRAVAGSVTPINGLAPDYAASTVLNEDEATRTPPTSTYDQPEGDENEATPTSHGSTIRPYLIIHPEYVPTHSSSIPATDSNNNADQLAPLTGGKSLQALAGPEQTPIEQAAATNGSSSNKVIRIYFPNSSSKQQQQQHQANAISNGSINESGPQQANSKRAPSIEPPAPSGANSNSSPPAYNETSSQGSQSNQTPVDYSTAPKNVSMMKVAQGWVLSWSAPARLPSPAEQAEERAEAMHQQRSNSSSLTMQQADEQQQQQQQAELNGVSLAGSGELSQQANKFDPTVLAYSIELKEKQSSNWLTLSVSREQSLLLKDLKPGTEYQFRVVAHAPGGLKGTPSAEFRYQIPDNRRKPGLSQAFSATVTSGLLFFIACIVIAVCGVNMCNKRRKKRAEKAAYVMMACPVLESHHDIAALNSNSLLKNGAANAAQDRVSGVSGHLARNLRLADQAQSRHGPTDKLIALGGSLKTILARAANYPNSATTAAAAPAAATRAANKPQLETPEWPVQREINFSSNAPVPVDVGPNDSLATPGAAGRHTTGLPGASPTMSQPPVQPPIDDYWIRQPSDRKWGTLTLAASKLAERRASSSRQEQAAVASQTTTSVHKLAQTQNQRRADEGLLTTVASARTLPRSFKSAPLLPNRPSSDTNQIIVRNEHAGSTLSSLQLQPPPLPPHAPKVAPRVTRLAAGAPPPRRPEVEPPAPPDQTMRNILREQAPPSSASFAAAAAAQHRRSISQIEARRASQLERSMVANQQANQCQWLPASNWTQQDLSDFASMSFGPPAQALALAGTTDWSLMWPSAANDSLDALQAPPTGQAFAEQHPFEVFKANRQLGSRNSMARSTLPLMAPPQTNVGPSILAPPYNFAHDLSHHQQQQQRPVAPFNNEHQNMSLCPFYPHYLLPLGPSANYDDDQHRQQQQQRAQQMSQDQPTTTNVIRDNDDPLTENACLGSYRRKRRLPHIEAQFTITKAPELPPKGSKGQLTSEHMDAGADASATHLLPSRPSESESLRRGHLFVRDAPPTIKPAGLPQPGQRTEQRRLRQASAAELNVERIGARDKVEVYLRHHQVAAKRAPPPPPPPAQASPQLAPPPPLGESSSSSSSVELNQVNELTFQPYYNLPSLKYTINLPLKSGHDGSLTLKKSASLRPVKCSTRRRSRANSEAPDVDRKWRVFSDQSRDQLGQRDQTASDKGQQLGALNVEAPPPIPPHRALAEQQQQQQQRVQVGPTNSNECQGTQASANVSGSSPSSSVVSSASCSAGSDETTNTANTDTGAIERSLSSTALASGRPTSKLRDGHLSNDLHDDLHSADENYEFDQVSSCSSSRVRRRVKRRSRSAGRLIDGTHTQGGKQPIAPNGQEAAIAGPEVSVLPSSEAIYTQVDKRRWRRVRKRDEACVESIGASVARSQFYDCARLKEQKLTCDSSRRRFAEATQQNDSSTMDGEVTLTNENVAHFYDTVYESLFTRSDDQNN